MATVNFSVPDEIKAAFNEAFKGENKSAIIARLMREAVEEKERREQRKTLIWELTRSRRNRPTASDEEIRKIREEERP